MTKILLSLILILATLKSNAQFEVSVGYAVNKNLADGIPFQLGHDFKIKDRLFTKTQAGFKYLYHYNDYVGVKIKVSILELHQTISY